MPNNPIQAESDQPNIAAVTGTNQAPTDQGFAMGVHGTSAKGEGVRGETNAQNHAAVAGFNNATDAGLAWGVFGMSQVGEGVHGQTRGNFAAVAAVNSDPGQGPGVFAHSDHGEGVHGETNAQNHAAVAGFNNATADGLAWGVFGISQVGEGVTGVTKSEKHGAVVGANQATADGLAWGVFGISQVGEGVHGQTGAPNHAAVAGFNSATGAGPAWGVFGASQVGEGVHGETNSATFAAVAGIARGAGPAGFFQGNVIVTGDIFLQNADCAEDFDIAIAEMEVIEPGMVMVIEQESTLRPSQHAYDKRVAGVISGAGQCKPGIVLDKQASQENRRPIALMGKVYCKVDAQYAPIEVGDLLTTSPTLGHAMKAVDPVKAFGAVIGKALRPLEAGQGLIPILIALQ